MNRIVPTILVIISQFQPSYSQTNVTITPTQSSTPSASASTSASPDPNGDEKYGSQQCDKACETYELIKDNPESQVAIACGKKDHVGKVYRNGLEYESYDACKKSVENMVAASGQLALYCEAKKITEAALETNKIVAGLYWLAFATCTTSCITSIASLGTAATAAEAACTAADLAGSAMDIVETTKISDAGDTASDLLENASISYNSATSALGGVSLLTSAAGLGAMGYGLTKEAGGSFSSYRELKRNSKTAGKTATDAAKESGSADLALADAEKALKNAKGDDVKELTDKLNTAKEAAEKAKESAKSTKEAAKNADEAVEAGWKGVKEAAAEGATSGKSGAAGKILSCASAAFLGVVASVKTVYVARELPNIKATLCDKEHIGGLGVLGTFSLPSTTPATTPDTGGSPPPANTGDSTPGSGTTENNGTPGSILPSSAPNNESTPLTSSIAAATAADATLPGMKNALQSLIDPNANKIAEVGKAVAGGVSPAAALGAALPDLPETVKNAAKELQAMADNGAFAVAGMSAYSGGGGGKKEGGSAASKAGFDLLSRMSQKSGSAATAKFEPAKAATAQDPCGIPDGEGVFPEAPCSVFDIAMLIGDTPELRDSLEHCEPCDNLNRAIAGLRQLKPGEKCPCTDTLPIWNLKREIPPMISMGGRMVPEESKDEVKSLPSSLPSAKPVRATK